MAAKGFPGTCVRIFTRGLLGVSLLASGGALGCVTGPYERPVLSQGQVLGGLAGGVAGAAIGHRAGSNSREGRNAVIGGLTGALLGGWLGGELERSRYDRRPYGGSRY
ncbi:MAG: hypothetical protein OZ948_18840 [Deltaproteobacteria bacterium]|nr:hypothetical protein [Deltaproteobacteria bacterium]